MPMGRGHGRIGRQSNPTRASCRSFERVRLSSYSRVPTEFERQAYEDLIRRLTQWRHRQGLTQEDLDLTLGIAEGSIAKWESFSRLPGAFMFACWAAALKVTLVPIGE
jgi:DNA-binding XRE family transcriptional regulator